MKRISKKMQRIGLRPERLQLEWISAAEGQRFKEVMEKMESLRQSVTAEEIAETKRILAEEKKKPRGKTEEDEKTANSSRA